MIDNRTNNISLQLITEQSSLVDTIRENSDIMLERVYSLSAPGEWRYRSRSFDATLLDLRSKNNSTQDAIKHISEVKKFNPAHFFIVVGDSEQLVDLLDSEIHSLLYRVFSSSTPHRLMLNAIRSAGALRKTQQPGTPSPAPPGDQIPGDVETVGTVKKPTASPNAVVTTTGFENDDPGTPGESGLQTADESGKPEDSEDPPADIGAVPVKSAEPLVAGEYVAPKVVGAAPCPVEMDDAIDDEPNSLTSKPEDEIGALLADEVVEPEFADGDEIPGIDDETNDLRDLDSGKTESSLGKAPFLLFATIGMPALAWITYLLLWDQQVPGSIAAPPLLQQQSPAIVEPAAVASIEPAQTTEKQTPADPAIATGKKSAGDVSPIASVEPAKPTAAEVSPSEKKKPTKPSEEKVSPIVEKEPANTPAATDDPQEAGIVEKLIDSIKTASREIIDGVADTPSPDAGKAIESDNKSEKKTSSKQNASIEQLLKSGRNAEAEVRSFEPREDNALFYYEQVLKINAANVLAKKGRARTLNVVRATIRKEVDNRRFFQANEILTRFRYSHPDHSVTRSLSAILSTGMERELAPIRSDPASDIDAAIAMLNKLGPEFSKTRDALLRLKKERYVLERIDWAIAGGFLLPPDPRNVFEKILQARRDRSVSVNKLNDRALEVSRKLYQRAEHFIASDDLAGARTIAEAMKTLNVDQSSIQQIDLLLGQSGEAPAQAAASDGQVENLIVEAKVLKMVEPQYPLEARDQRIEGWVRLNFVVDETGQIRELSVVGEEPVKIFTDAALAAIAQWQFQPAHDQIARINVVSNFTVKLDFTLPE